MSTQKCLRTKTSRNEWQDLECASLRSRALSPAHLLLSKAASRGKSSGKRVSRDVDRGGAVSGGALVLGPLKMRIPVLPRSQERGEVAFAHVVLFGRERSFEQLMAQPDAVGVDDVAFASVGDLADAAGAPTRCRRSHDGGPGPARLVYCVGDASAVRSGGSARHQQLPHLVTLLAL